VDNDTDDDDDDDDDLFRAADVTTLLWWLWSWWLCWIRGTRTNAMQQEDVLVKHNSCWSMKTSRRNRSLPPPGVDVECRKL
jgi:hypothetical protein